MTNVTNDKLIFEKKKAGIKNFYTTELYCVELTHVKASLWY